MRCANCGHGNRKGARFCDSCGAELVASDASTAVDTAKDIGLTPDFVGRPLEMDELVGALEDARRGRGRLVMLAGEPGIGKTRTAQELASIVEHRGYQVLWGRCYEAESSHTETERDRRRLEAQLKRARELYEWGDFTKAEYLARRSDLTRRMDDLPTSGQPEADVLGKLAKFLADVPAAWEAATQEQRNKLARTLFDEVWLRDKEVVAVKPRRELDPFFRLNYEESEAGDIEGRVLRRVESYREHGNLVLVAA